MSWVESGYISHPTTDNQFSVDDSSFDVRDREIYNVSAMFDETMTIQVCRIIVNLIQKEIFRSV